MINTALMRCGTAGLIKDLYAQMKESDKLDKEIKKNLKGLGFGG